MQLSKRLRSFSVFFSLFMKSASNFKYFVKKMTLVAYVFLNLQTVQGMVTQMFK